jgi:acetyltransferase-like isoleucine patch superfamily enzyme
MTTSWGWATWRDSWSKFDANSTGYEQLKIHKALKYQFDLNGSFPATEMLLNYKEDKKIDSWVIRWWWSVFKENGITLFPDVSLVDNCGFDESATHTKNKTYSGSAEFNPNYAINNFPENIAVDKQKFKLICNYFSDIYLSNDVSQESPKYNKMKSLIQKIIAKLINSSFVILNPHIAFEVLDKLKSDQKKEENIKQLTTRGIVTLYEESNIVNLANDSSKITILDNSHIRGELLIFPYGGQISIGENSYVGEGCKIWSGESISIGNNVLIAHGVNIIDFSHEKNHEDRQEGFINLIKSGHPKNKGKIPTAGISIADNVAIYAGVNIMMGVSIGKGAILSAGAVITKDVPPMTIVMGNPAKSIWKTT